MKHTKEEYFCDRCGEKLKTHSNNICIVTEKDRSGVGSGGFWERFKVKIEFHHGLHNDGKKRDADLCKSCAEDLLNNALIRIKKGERISKGEQTSDQLGFNQIF